MRFARQDLPGLAIATLGGPLLFLLVLASFELWGHRHTVLLAGLSQNLAIGAALIAVFSRFIRRWDAVLGLLALIVLMVIGVNWLQRTGDGTTALAVLFKWVGVVIIVVNYRDTNNNNSGNAVPLSMNGGGQNSDGHILGGAVIYHRNQVHPTQGNGEILSRTLANVSGGGSIHFSAEAVNNVKVYSAVQVRSWRKLPE